MRQFFKYMFASTLGTILAFVAIFIFSGIILAGVIGSAMMMANKGGKKAKIEENSILVVDMSERLVERTQPSPFDNIEIEGFDDDRGIAINEFLAAIDAAKTDDRIKGIYLKGSMFGGSFTTLEEVREALISFQDSGKFVVAYEEIYTQGAYYLASSASDLYIFEEGMMEMFGLRTELAYFKNTLDKMGVGVTVLKGPDNKFKSAIEPFVRDDMSPENEMQIQRIVDVLWEGMVGNIAESRNMSVEMLDSIANGMLVKEPSDAVEFGLFDAAVYYDEVLADIRTKLEIEEGDDIEQISMKKYVKSYDKNDGEGDDDKSWELKDEIAVIYAIGGINSGKSDNESIGSETLAKAIREARTNEDVKAIVMRVTSPGGSALASDVIWREAKLAAEEKPFVVSFGSVAASGGYYISTHADRIFASENTITGSIGVFGLIPDVRGLVTDKWGITFDGVKTHDHSDFGSMQRGFDEAELAYLNASVTNTYNEFVERVADGRGMTVDEVDSLARGRVWIGTDAIENGLVDEIGSLNDAIDYAASQAELDDYQLIELPKKKDPWETFFKDLSGGAKAEVGEWVFGDEYKWVKKIEEVKSMEGIQARLPYDIDIH
ncbi:signal peptide peptidase SppA [Salibacteraceae bacterium]|nr:signal peptide peptidase SppA [Salibacteraceae bacterium]